MIQEKKSDLSNKQHCIKRLLCLRLVPVIMLLSSLPLQAMNRAMIKEMEGEVGGEAMAAEEKEREEYGGGSLRAALCLQEFVPYATLCIAKTFAHNQAAKNRKQALLKECSNRLQQVEEALSAHQNDTGSLSLKKAEAIFDAIIRDVRTTSLTHDNRWGTKSFEQRNPDGSYNLIKSRQLTNPHTQKAYGIETVIYGPDGHKISRKTTFYN